MNNYTSLDQLPLALSAEDVAQVLGISRANAYALMHSKGFPTLKIGKRMTVPKDKLIAWMEKQLAAYSKAAPPAAVICSGGAVQIHEKK